jgi:hypothetical protein
MLIERVKNLFNILVGSFAVCSNAQRNLCLFWTIVIYTNNKESIANGNESEDVMEMKKKQLI